MLLRNVFTDLTEPRFRFRFLGLSLIALLLALRPETSLALRTLCIFSHFALILIWQPLWHGTTALSGRTTTVLIASVCGLVLWPGWLIITVWLVIIIGLLGGEHAHDRRNRLALQAAMVCLFVTLLLIVVPLLFEITLGSALLESFAFFAALGLAITLLFIPTPTSSRPLQQIDYLRTLSITSLALLLSSGTVLWMYRANIPYTEALFQTLIFSAVFIIAINWLWVSQSGHSIMQTLWNRYLLNLGTPFERYLIFLSENAQKHTTPANFLHAALENLLALEWVTGITWSAQDQLIELGETSPHKTAVTSDGVQTTVHSRQQIGPALVLHIQLLVHLIEHFYFALVREAELATHLRLEAIHQTGSRLTHDIKNLLQSMHYLAAVVEASKPEQAQESLQLLQNQFPALRQRMQATLEKLKKPEEFDNASAVAQTWWQQLKRRYADADISFVQSGNIETAIPKELFDNAAENLLENARYKQSMDHSVMIEAKLFIRQNALVFSVRDSGDPVEKDIAENLFQASVPSRQGLGVGLFQSAQLAQRHGYVLALVENSIDTGVCIELTQELQAGT